MKKHAVALTWNEEGIELMRIATQFRTHWMGHFYESAKFDKELAKLLLAQRIIGRNEEPRVDFKVADVDVKGRTFTLTSRGKVTKIDKKKFHERRKKRGRK